MNKSEKQQPNDEYISMIAKYLNVILAGQSDIAAAYLLGSAKLGKMRRDSDIDVALLPVEGRNIPVLTRLALASQLESKLNRTIDIGVISAQNLIYASEAIFNGRRIVTVQKNYTQIAETRLLGCYFTFRQDRKEVEESYSAA